MTKSPFQHRLYKALIYLLFAIPVLGFSRNAGEPGDPVPPDSTTALGHLMCLIRADTNCVDKTVTLEAWSYYTFTGVSDPLVATWSNGQTAHKITVTPPGIWSWDASNIGCEPVHQFNEINFSRGFFNGPIDISGPTTLCPTGVAELTVDIHGYLGLSSFTWSTAYQTLTPYPVSQSGTYALTVTDALGCSFTDEIAVTSVPPGEEGCQDACVYCDFDEFQGSNEGSVSNGAIICGQINLQNAKWLGFVAGTETIAMEVAASNCQNGDGLQLAIFNNCSDKQPIVCDPGCSGCGNETFGITHEQFTPGETYWLLVDGYVGDICDFTINVIDGSTVAPVLDTASVPQGPTTLCTGATATYSIPPVAGAGYYHWEAPAGASINGLSNKITLKGSAGTSVEVIFGDSTGTVCVQAGNACAPSTPKRCLEVAFQGVDTTIKPPLVLCYQDLPYTWDEAPYPTLSAPGIYHLTASTYDSQVGCDSVVLQTISIQPPLITNLGTVQLCPGDCFDIIGQTYCMTGTYIITLTSFLGCDSLVRFTLKYLDPEANIQGPNLIFCNQTDITLESTASTGTNIWSNETGQILGNGASLIVTQPGTYILTNRVQSGNLECAASDTLQVSASQALGDIQVEGAAAGCSTDSLVLSCVITTTNPQFVWSGPNGFSSTDQNPLILLPGDYGVTVTNQEGCQGTASATVAYTGGTPDAQAIGDLVNCTQTLGQLNGISLTVGATFSWTGPDGFQSNEEDPAISTVGEYVLTVTGPGGCTSTAVTYLEADIALPNASAQSDAINCLDSIGILTGSSTTLGATFQWSGPDGFQSSEPSPQVTTPGAYLLTVTGPNGCTNTATIYLVVDSAPPNASAQSDAINCLDSIGILTGSSTTLGATFQWSGPDGFQSSEPSPQVTTPGAYLLTVTGPNGCTNTAAAELIAQTTSPGVVLFNDTIICTTYPHLVCQTSAQNPSYSWSGPNGFTSTLASPEAQQSGVYTVTVTDPTNGCTSTAENTVFAFQKVWMILTDAIIQPTIGQSNGSIDIHVPSVGTPVLQYQWYLNGVQIADTEDVANLAAGTYTLVITDNYGCTTTQSFVLQGVSGIEEVQDIDGWVIRPNPSTGRFELEYKGPSHGATHLLVYDNNGRRIWYQEVESTQDAVNIDLTSWPTGVYMLEIRGESVSRREKLVVQR